MTDGSVRLHEIGGKYEENNAKRMGTFTLNECFPESLESIHANDDKIDNGTNGSYPLDSQADITGKNSVHNIDSATFSNSGLIEAKKFVE